LDLVLKINQFNKKGKAMKHLTMVILFTFTLLFSCSEATSPEMIDIPEDEYTYMIHLKCKSDHQASIWVNFMNESGSIQKMQYEIQGDYQMYWKSPSAKFMQVPEILVTGNIHKNVFLRVMLLKNRQSFKEVIAETPEHLNPVNIYLTGE
jgi:hypothetical protein